MSAHTRPVDASRLAPLDFGALPGLYDPCVASDGLTVDTDLGPVDLVAIERARSGWPVDLTAAEVAYLFAELPATLPAVRPVAEALDLSLWTVRDRARRAMTATKIA